MISVHAVSIIFELRSLRARLQHIIDRDSLFLTAASAEDIGYALSVVDLMTRKVENLGTYITSLHQVTEELRVTAEVGLGEERQQRHGDHGSVHSGPGDQSYTL